MAVETPSVKLNMRAPVFTLPATDGQTYSFENIAGEAGTVVMFICNHCPYVKSATARIVNDMKALQLLGVNAVAINSNDALTYPEDSFENMIRFAGDNGFTFPYLWDESQDTARAYGAVCTPDYFGFNANMELQYRGRLDANRRIQEDAGASRDLLEAMSVIAKTGVGPDEQFSSMGCSIKWKD